MLQPNLADHAVSDFQHWPPWPSPGRGDRHRTGPLHRREHLIAPQTVLARGYLEEIFAGLRAGGLAVFHVLLDADQEVLRRRIQGSDEAQAWRLAHLAGYRAARPWLCQAADLVVDTAAAAPDEVAEPGRQRLAGSEPRAGFNRRGGPSGPGTRSGTSACARG